MIVILSPHPDDVLLSLYDSIRTEYAKEVILAVNVFSTTNHVNSGPGKKISNITITRIREELDFAEHLDSLGISYTPVFLGLRDASMELGSDAKASWKRSGDRDEWGDGLCNRRLNLGMHLSIQCLLKQYEKTISQVMVPLGLSHADHLFLRRVGDRLRSLRVSYYVDIPYSHRYTNLAEVFRAAHFNAEDSKVVAFDYERKIGLFSRIYASQYDKQMAQKLKASVRIGECIALRKRRAH